ncbi:alpha/beta-hydrolase [Metschnikowia bicuspidata var. bicuspidata NRRL YB-4993]|uniref:Alpha/beta-hydrolase n=1 Tax=Metschnikowia bicuspidata var. bicuspidata NRRL YB-4993 TaxID=869754 RepID=A0A1A0HD32_9ASCO|nr:alpha/beta-hydrolase [Metschnikowia bicuspidata var. bicuspidata NRRL YB-4993]OBA21885.1 alpha/beta-hydrolase [Metschnikowia bicuspidata var. bicuspidata NRRL YB-4993]
MYFNRLAGISSHVHRAVLRPRAWARSYQFSVNEGDYLGDALSLEIKTVPLEFDKHEPQNKPESSKSPLVFLHGIFGLRSNTRTVARQLANSMGRDVFCLDLRNFGDSPHFDRLDYPALAADVERFVDEQKFEHKPVLVGHSMGAKTAMAVALRRPDLPKMVVSVDNVPVATLAVQLLFPKYIRQLRHSLEVEKRTKMSDVDADLAQVEPTKEIRQFILKNVRSGLRTDVCRSKIPLETIANAVVKGNIANWPYDHHVAKWTKGPALFIRGTNSPYVPDEAIADIANYFPQFEVRDIEAGHWVISEKPAEFMDVLQEFVERKEDGEMELDSFLS